MEYKLLAVDDEPAICDIMSAFFTKKGFITFTATSGEEALKIIDKDAPDIILLDLNMPGIGGMGLLKELERKNIDTPVIVLSGGEESGSYDYIQKNADLNVILQKVQSKLDKK